MALPPRPGPPRILELEDDLRGVLERRGCIGGRVAWKRNAAGEYVVALIVPARFASESQRALDLVSPREEKRRSRR